MVPFDRSHTSSCQRYIVTMACYLVPIARYSELLVENREIFIPHLYLTLPQGNFVKMFDVHKNTIIGLLYGEKLWQYVKPFSQNTGTSRTGRRTDAQTDKLAIPISRVSMLTRVWALLISPYAPQRTNFTCSHSICECLQVYQIPTSQLDQFRRYAGGPKIKKIGAADFSRLISRGLISRGLIIIQCPSTRKCQISSSYLYQFPR